MNRIEFMTQLAALLQDVPVEERREAMKYYNDYFDDAGAENEQQVIAELESPEKVAENIKEDLKGTFADSEEFTENRYADVKADDKEMSGKKDYTKIILIVMIAVILSPIVIPLAFAVLATVAACVVSLFALFISIVVTAVAVAIAGIVLVVQGMIVLIPDFVVGIGLVGVGLIFTVIGTVGTVASVKLCMIVFPALFKVIVKLCRKLFHRKAVA